MTYEETLNLLQQTLSDLERLTEALHLPDVKELLGLPEEGTTNEEDEISEAVSYLMTIHDVADDLPKHIQGFLSKGGIAISD